MDNRQVVAIFSIFENLSDPRLERTKRHKLFDIVVLGLCGALAGCDSWADVERYGVAKRKFFGRFLELLNGIPSHDTFGRVFAALDTEEFLHCLSQWLEQLELSTAGQVVAIDGKTLRGSFDKSCSRSALHLVSAWATQNRLVLGQVAVDDKSNEITAIPQLLKMIDVAGATVTIDAMGCQKAIAAGIREAGADYVLAVKDNQPTLHAQLQDEFISITENQFADPDVRRWVTHDEGHGRDETREYVVAPVPAAVQQTGDWKDIQTIGMVVSTRKLPEKESVEVRHFITSLPVKVKNFARAVRGHWGIENKLHWSLDVTFAEDKSRIRKKHGPQNCALLRRLALSILQQDTSVKDNIRGKRKRAGWDDNLLLRFLTGFSGN